MTSSASRPALPYDVLGAMVGRDGSRPRLTFYDDAPGPTHGERIELSGRVLMNWVAKAGNALQDELDVAPGRRVVIALPVHWRALYWSLATWAVGGTVVLTDDQGSGTAAEGPHDATTPGADAPRLHTPDDIDAVTVTDHPDLASTATRSAGAVLVSLPMLSRGHPRAPAGVMDEARELATHGDVLDVWQAPAPGDIGLVGADGATTAYGGLVVARPEWGQRPRVELTGSLDRVLRDSLSAWYADGSVVLVRSPDGDQQARATAEGVTVRLG